MDVFDSGGGRKNKVKDCINPGRLANKLCETAINEKIGESILFGFSIDVTLPCYVDVEIAEDNHISINRAKIM